MDAPLKNKNGFSSFFLLCREFKLEFIKLSFNSLVIELKQSQVDLRAV